jgi:hypothetical protein
MYVIKILSFASLLSFRGEFHPILPERFSRRRSHGSGGGATRGFSFLLSFNALHITLQLNSL